MKKTISVRMLPFIVLSLVTILPVSAQKPAYMLFREDGRKSRYDRMVNEALQADVVLFGELHNNPVSHWLQLELTRSLYEDMGKKLIMGAEMFEADNQLIVNEYFDDLITEERFEAEVRLWNNYITDYKPLVTFAKDSGLDFVATNVPRRYANSVFYQGLGVLDDLSDEARSFMAPLPLVYDTSLNCYSMLIHGSQMPGHASINLADAQAIKDATMARFILENREPGSLFIHFNGAGHSDNFENIYWWLKQARPELKIMTISTVLQDRTDDLEKDSEGRADFIIVVPSSMTTTY